MVLRTPQSGLRARAEALGEAHHARAVVMAALTALLGTHTIPEVSFNVQSKTLTIHCTSKAIANEVFLLREQIVVALAKEGLRNISVIVR